MNARLGFVAAAALGVSIAGCGGGQARSNKDTIHARAARVLVPVAHPIGSFRVGTSEVEFSEPASGAAATTSDASGQALRSIPTSIRYPAPGAPDATEHPGAPVARAQGPFPLIVFSQGFDVAGAAYAPLLDALTSAGYVVAAPQYPATDPSDPRGINEADLVNHPTDLRFVLAHLLAGVPPPPGGIVDRHEVALVGQSDGGDVSLAAAANGCCTLAAVKAAVILSGAEWASFGGTYFRTRSVPLLVVQGSSDSVNLPGCSARIYDAAPQPKYYLDLLGAGHLPPYLDAGPVRAIVARATVDFLDAYLKRSAAGANRLRRDGNVAGAAQLSSGPGLPGAATACPGAP